MDFQPFLTQLIPHPGHRYLLPNALTLAALGEPDHKIRKYRPNLREGEHFVYFTDDSNRRRLFYTFAGLLQLSTLLNTERAKRLRDSLIAWLGQSNSAIVHQPLNSHQLYSQPTFEDDYPITPVSPCPLTPHSQTSYPPQTYSQPTVDIDQPSPSGSLLNSPVLRELLQLKRDEIELQRSQQETERLKLFQSANAHHQPKATTPTPPQIHIENRVETGWYYWERGFIESLAMLIIFLTVLVGFGVMVGSGLSWFSRQTGGYEHVR